MFDFFVSLFLKRYYRSYHYHQILFVCKQNVVFDNCVVQYARHVLFVVRSTVHSDLDSIVLLLLFLHILFVVDDTDVERR